MLILNHYHENPDKFSCYLDLSTFFSCIPRSHSQYIYTKETYQPGYPEKEGCYETRTKDGRDIYTGKFVLDNEHGNSIYKWIRDEGITVYEGYIFCNIIQGYGRFSYPDGSFHEGLYKNNRRYGPGVHTEPDGKQNVGMWRNMKLLKLSVNVNAQVPTLYQTREGRAKALRFKNVVEVQRYKDKAKHIFYDMYAPSHIVEISDCLYNVLTKDPRSETFNWNPYEETYAKNELKMELEELEQILDKPEKTIKIRKPKKNEKSRWKKKSDEMDGRKVSGQSLVTNATHLISWNNSIVMKDMMLFCHKHIFQEEAISYEVADIIKCKRECFRAPGTHEILCVRFLKKCKIGNYSRVNDYLAFKCIDPNLADSDGNTGLIIAAANDQIAVIDVLLDHGADINLCNDDGFTPLALCATRYLGLVNHFKDWEKQFLSNLGEINYPENALKWRHPGKEPRTFYKYLDDIEDDEIPTREDTRTKEKNENSRPDSQDTADKIALVKETIFKLIQRGADLMMSNVPMPVLIMAIKSQDVELTRRLLEAKCNKKPLNPDDPFLQDTLYTAVQLPAGHAMTAITTTLLQYGADPNEAIERLQDDKKLLELCDLSEEEIGEKTVLHYLATRPDGLKYNEHLCAEIKILLSNGANPDAIYLGHTPLSAAIVKGNVGIIECLMSLQVDPNQKLAKELGVPLTFLMKALCLLNLPIKDAKNIVDILVNNGADLLKDVQVGSFTGSVTEFVGIEIEKLRHDDKKSRLSGKGSAQDCQSLLHHIAKLAQQDLTNKVMEVLNKSRQLPKPHTSGFSPKTGSRPSRITPSTDGREEQKEVTMPELPSWITADDIIHILNNIQEKEKSQISKEEASIILQRVIPSDSQNGDQQQLERFLSRIKGSSGYDAEGSKSLKTSPRESGEKMFRRESRRSWNLLEALKNRSNSLQSDDYEPFKEVKKSDVCFGCGHTFNEELLRLCPECKLVKFCSPECFWKARKNGTHKCTGDIFPDWKDPRKSSIDNDWQDQQPDRTTNQENGEIKRGSSKTDGEKRKSLDKRSVKKQSVKEDTEIQDLSEKELAKERKRGTDAKSKDNEFYEHPEIKKKRLTKELFNKQSVIEDAGIQDIPDKDFEKEELEDKKRKSQGKRGTKKQSVKRDTGIQDLSEKELAKERKRGTDAKSKDNEFYEHPEIKKKRLTKELFKKESDTKRSVKSDSEKDRSQRFEKYSRGQGDYIENKYHKGGYIEDKNQTGTKEDVNRIQGRRGDIKKENKYISTQDSSDFDLKLERIPNGCSKVSNYNIVDFQLNGTPHMFQDGSMYYTNNPENRQISKLMEQENYAFN